MTEPESKIGAVANPPKHIGRETVSGGRKGRAWKEAPETIVAMSFPLHMIKHSKRKGKHINRGVGVVYGTITSLSSDTVVTRVLGGEVDE
jgi:hypothetical protein